jgi:hypothetical protein
MMDVATSFDIENKGKLRWLLLLFACMVFSLLCITFLSGSKAHALVALNPDPGATIPSSLRDYLINCDSYGPSPAFVQWMGPQSDSTSTTIPVGYGTRPIIQMEYWFAGAVCQPNSAVTDTSVRIAGATLSSAPQGWIPNIVGAQRQISFNPYNSVGKFDKTSIVFTYDHGQNIYATQNVTVTLDTQFMNRFFNNTYLCVAGPGGNKGSIDPSPCNTTQISFTFTLEVGPPPLVDNASCTFTSVNTSPIAPGSAFNVTIQLQNTGTTTWIPGQWNLGSAPGQTNNFVTNGGGQARASWPNGNWVGPGGVVTFNFNWTAPGSPGTYPFEWKMVHEGVAWFGGTCGPNITVAIGDIATCLSASISNVPGTTYPNGQYRMTITVRNDGGFTWIPGQWNLGSAWGQTNNYVTDGGGEIRASWSSGSWVGPGGTATFTYTAVMPNYGGTYASNWKMVHEGVAWFGFTNGGQCGFNFTVAQGRLGDAFNWNNPESGTIETCSMGQVHTGANGMFTFVVPQGWGYCTRATRDGSAPDNYWVRPWNENYIECPGTNGATPPDQGYCTSRATYECQVSGSVISAAACGIGGIDRQQDYGFDIALAWRPSLNCSFSGASSEPGVAFTPNVTLQRNPTSGTSPPTVNYPVNSLTYNINSAPPQSSRNPAGGSFSGATSPQIQLDNPPSLTVAAAGNYNESVSSNSLTSGPYTDVSVSCGNSISTAFKPYLKAFGADVWAGGGFNNTTCPSNAGINAFAQGSGTAYSGSSGQFGVTALMQINGFYSASTRTPSAPLAPKGDTFSNTAGSATYGGAFGGSGICTIDYFNETKNSPGPSGNLVAATASAPAGKSQYNLISTNIAPADVTVPIGKQIAVYVTGNVYIDHNIRYDTAGRGNNKNNIPYLAVIVLGNIYIAPNVTQLDGLYVAQPPVGAEATQGRIYTCGKNGSFFATNEINENCSANQLVVNGALIAQQVKFMRTFKSLKDSTVGEKPSNFGTGQGTNAAEVINYSGEMFMAPSPLKDPDDNAATVGADKYDAVFSLPPVF